MDGLLNLQRITKTNQEPSADITVSVSIKKHIKKTLDCADDIVKTLRTQPDFLDLGRCLETLYKKPDICDIRVPSPKATQIANALAKDVLPNYWQLLKKPQDDTRLVRKHLLWCFKTVVGIGALVLRLRELAERQSADEVTQAMQESLEVLETVLRGGTTVSTIFNHVFGLIEKSTSCQITWDGFLSYLAGSKILNAASAAEERLRGPERSGKQSWLSDGSAYTRWLACNIRMLDVETGPNLELRTKARSKLFVKGLFLGFKNELIETIFSGALSGDSAAVTQDITFLRTLKTTEIHDVVFILFEIGSRHSVEDPDRFVKGFGALLGKFCEHFDSLPSALLSWLVRDTEGRASTSILVRRAIFAVLDNHAGIITEACEILLKRFGDKLYIQSAPVLQQEVHTQDLLLMIGHIQHSDASLVRQISQSAPYLTAISNRLGASSPRASLLGMLLGVAVSELVDPLDKRLKFDDERLSNEDGEWYRSLVQIHDRPGDISDLQASHQTRRIPRNIPKHKFSTIPASKPERSSDNQPSASSSSESEEDPDLPRLSKPDSDPSDSEDDPTLINRSAPKPPVYIRDLLKGLKDVENYDVYQLALTNAGPLIRRKANFGSEVSAHASSLATQLAGVSDTFNMERFEEHRMRGMIALVVAQPRSMGPWFAEACFTGDYSIAQRASMLTALTMAARELAGYREEDAALTGASRAVAEEWPSRKRLGTELEQVYGGRAGPGRSLASGIHEAIGPVSAAADRMQSALLQPVAAAAADTLAGRPSQLRLHTFSSRLPARPKARRVDNALAGLLADCMFHPLAARLRLSLAAPTSRSPFAVPFLLAHSLKTLALLLAAAGPSTLSLAGLVAEFLGLCVWGPVRGAAARQASVREAVLFGLMVILDTATGEDKKSSEREFVREHAQELLEVQAWCETVFGNTPRAKGGDELEGRISQLAAGVLVRCGEIVERYRQEMMGELARFA